MVAKINSKFQSVIRCFFCGADTAEVGYVPAQHGQGVCCDFNDVKRRCLGCGNELSEDDNPFENSHCIACNQQQGSEVRNAFDARMQAAREWGDFRLRGVPRFSSRNREEIAEMLRQRRA
jgi:DNA-directed RNA polymerase subunit N (RpoN/RPB10)